MKIIEIVIWSAMTGALLLLMLIAAIDVMRLGNRAAWRGLSFVLLTGVSAIVMTGLPEHVLHITNDRLLLPVKVSLGPLSGALTLTYLGIWLGLGFEDRWLRWLIVTGSFMTLLSAIGLALAAFWWPATSPSLLLAISAGVNLLSAVIGAMAAVRGSMLGDALARWMVLACIFLSVMVAGLYAKGMQLNYGLAVYVLTAMTTVGYFMVVTTLTLLRNQNLKRLHRLARGNYLMDEITGLPMGSVLLSKVDDALWRSARAGNQSAVMALWIHNLYDLNNHAGHYMEHEIRTRLTATLRQAVGFRNVVGLMQARCFVVVISAVQDRVQIEKKALRLLLNVRKTMQVGELVGDPHAFAPHAGIGIVFTPAHDHADPLPAMDKAQKLAQQALGLPCQLLQENL
jgi:GGDEF domain-containing protein